MYNYYRESWLVDRYAGTLESEFGQAPCVSVADDTILSVLVVSEDPASLDCPTDDVFRRPADTPPPVSDDRPFPFLRERTVPAFYVVSIVAMLVVSLIAVCGVGGPLRNMRPFADLFFMGVLVSVLLAVLLSKRVRFPDLRVLYALLLAAVVVAWSCRGALSSSCPRCRGSSSPWPLHSRRYSLPTSCSGYSNTRRSCARRRRRRRRRHRAGSDVA